jgi:general stress protein YciG
MTTQQIIEHQTATGPGDGEGTEPLATVEEQLPPEDESRVDGGTSALAPEAHSQAIDGVTGASTPAAAPDKKPDRPKSRRGFAAMDPALVREIASKGGKAAHAAGTAHEFNSEEARLAGRKGGQAAHRHHANNR